MVNDIITIAVVTALAFIGLYQFWISKEVDEAPRLTQQDRKLQFLNIGMLLIVAFVIKSIMAVNSQGYVTDIDCFKSWSQTAFEHGISQFYRIDQGNGYPPGYIVLLWIIGLIRHIFGIDNDSTAGLYLVKFFPILFDLATGFVLYVMSKKRFSEGISLAIVTMYVLNPAILIDSSIWGQVDSVFVLTVLLTCWLCMEEKRIPAYFVFCLGALLKFQTIMFAPILIFTIIEQVFLHDFNVKKMMKDLVGGLAAIASMFVFAIPFGLDVVIPKYVNSLELFEYCTINAYNFWVILGKNWAAQTDKFMFVSCETWGTIAIVASVLLSGFVFFRMKEDKSKYFASMAVLISFVFLFSVRMHERYLFPAVVLILATFLFRPTKELFYTFIAISAMQFINVAHVFYTWQDLGTTGPEGNIMGFTAILTLFFACFLVYSLMKKSDVVYEGGVAQVKPTQSKEKYKFEILGSKKIEKMGRNDFIVLFVILAVYSAIALFQLGDKIAPEIGWVSHQAGSQIVIDLGESKTLDHLYAYTGCYENRQFQVDVSEDGQSYTSMGTVQVGSVFRWNDLAFESSVVGSELEDFLVKARYLRMTSLHDDVEIMEIVLMDDAGNVLTPVNPESYEALFDEQDKFEPALTFRSGTYFDEVYHARTAYEMIQGIYCYENTHPPLGKWFISLGVRAFGMNPFGWRIVGTLFGIGMIPFIYLFGKRLFNKTWLAGVVTVLFAFDFMHFAQTRIATIDVYGTFFIMAMFYFMLRYAQTSFYDTEFKKTLIPLGISGVMMGLGCASKWTAVYASAGLAIFFFAIIFRRYMEYRHASKTPSGSSAGIAHSHIIKTFRTNTWKTLACCLVFFVLVPGIIYLLSYIPFNDGSDNGVWTQMINNQKTMFSYHSNLQATHAYSSTWKEWPTMIRPVFYYCNTLADGLKEGISAFGNPLVWWMGIFAFAYMIYRLVKKHDRISLFLVFAYLVQYIPWMLVPRCTFAYHYFPSVPFVVLMLGYTFACFVGENKKRRNLVYLYCAAAVALFVLFYPVISGYPVSTDYVVNGLKWLPGWVFIL